MTPSPPKKHDLKNLKLFIQKLSKYFPGRFKSRDLSYNQDEERKKLSSSKKKKQKKTIILLNDSLVATVQRNYNFR